MENDSELPLAEDAGDVPDRQTVIVNVFGGPGSGKTTAAHEITCELARRGALVEYVPEYAKELTWDRTCPASAPIERTHAAELLDGAPHHQFQIFREQQRREARLMGQVDFIVTDSPLPLCMLYMDPSGERSMRDRVAGMVEEAWRGQDRVDVLVTRGNEPYLVSGRNQTEREAHAKDHELTRLLDRLGCDWVPMWRGRGGAAMVADAALGLAEDLKVPGARERMSGHEADRELMRRAMGLVPYWTLYRNASCGTDASPERDLDGLVAAARAFGLVDSSVGIDDAARYLLDPRGQTGDVQRLDACAREVLGRFTTPRTLDHGSRAFVNPDIDAYRPIAPDGADLALMDVKVALDGDHVVLDAHVDGSGAVLFDSSQVDEVMGHVNSPECEEVGFGPGTLRWDQGTGDLIERCYVGEPNPVDVRCPREPNGLYAVGSETCWTWDVVGLAGRAREAPSRGSGEFTASDLLSAARRATGASGGRPADARVRGHGIA